MKMQSIFILFASAAKKVFLQVRRKTFQFAHAEGIQSKSGQQISSTSVLENKKWMHLAYVYDGKTKKQLLYVNGKLESEIDHPEDEVSKGQLPKSKDLGL